MKISSVLWISLIVVITAAQKNKGKVCTAPNIKRAKCVPGKGRCLPRVVGVAYRLQDVTSRSFIATWNPQPAAKCYFVQVLIKNTQVPLRTVSCFKGTSFKATGLRPWTDYGFRVSVVNRFCKRGPPSKPPLRIKTNWDNTFVISTEAPTKLMTPKAGKCGHGRFTCQKSKWKKKMECVPNRQWCDRIKQCQDGSDERGCPGSCHEIDVDFKNGNYSCTRYGSPGSFCFFDCYPGYERDGSNFIYCVKGTKQWSGDVPVCRLIATNSLQVLPEETTDTSITISWGAVEKAVQYFIQAVHHVTDEEVSSEQDTMVSSVVNSTECCTSTIMGLKPDTEYEISLYALNSEGLRGMASPSIFVNTGGSGGSGQADGVKEKEP